MNEADRRVADDWESPLRDLVERVGRPGKTADERADLAADERVSDRWQPDRFGVNDRADEGLDGDATDETFVWVSLGGSVSTDASNGSAPDDGPSLDSLAEQGDDASVGETGHEKDGHSVDESDETGEAASAFAPVVDRLDGIDGRADARSTTSETDSRSTDGETAAGSTGGETDTRPADGETDAVQDADAAASVRDSGGVDDAAATTPHVAEGTRTDSETDLSVDLASAVSDHTSSLLFGPLNGELTSRACSELLQPPDGGEYNLLLICITESPHDRLATIRQHGQSFPENIRVVTVDDDVSNPDTNTTVTIQGTERTIDIKTVTNPSNLSRLGIMISKHLSEWEGEEVPTMVCLHSLSALLQYVSPKQLFQFSHLLQNRLQGFDATVHFHVDPGVHDEVTLAQIEPLAERAVEVDDAGTITVD